MSFRSAFLLLFALSTQQLFAQQPGVQRPKLVVGVVIDQMRYDYLYRFYDRYGTGGFRRLLEQGHSCEQAMINYLPAYTAPGHACIYTGSVPSVHGIAGNNWIDNLTRRAWYCTEDTTVTPVGGTHPLLRQSPRNLRGTTITDELNLATNFRSRVIGISLKDRGSILPAGHTGKAFWYDDKSGNFVTSTYYSNSLPGWMERFNARKLPDSLAATGWQLSAPAERYRQSLPDSNAYEAAFRGGGVTFPHSFAPASYKSVIRSIPAGNTFVLEAAKACLDGERLGRGEATDVLAVSLSSTDYIGHQFAPNSVEIEDTYVKLDRDLAAFLDYLDSRVGKDNYLLFLTADHGGAHNVRFLNDIRVPAVNRDEDSIAKALKDWAYRTLGDSTVVHWVMNYQVFLKKSESYPDLDVVKAKLTEYLLQDPEIAYVLDMEHPESAAVPEPVRAMAVNGYNRQRSGELLILFHPGSYFGYGQTGTTHGTWHPYDSHIPLLWYGWGIRKGATRRTVHMTDISATLAALLHIQMPSGCIGTVIPEVIR